MEFLLVNHPLDCPICDQGGECDLQDQSMNFGTERGRMFDEKRTVEDKDIGPLVKTVMNRCIHCTRCVRYAEEICGVPVLGTLGRGNMTEIGTYVDDKYFDSELSGNVIDLCPVGALTAQPSAFTARPWELKGIETVCAMDASGSNIVIDVTLGKIKRIKAKMNDSVNEEWISDKARFSYDGLTYQRLDLPLARVNGGLEAKTWPDILPMIQEKVQGIKPSQMKAVAGAHADGEALMALKDMMNKLGCENTEMRTNYANPGFDAHVRNDYMMNSSIMGIESADLLLIIGTNPRMESPVINARMRKSFLNYGMEIALIGHRAELTYDYDHLGDSAKVLADIASGKHPFAERLKAAETPCVVVGDGALANGDAQSVRDSLDQLRKSIPNLCTEEWNGIGYLHCAASQVGGLDLGFVPGRDADNSDIKFVYLLQADEGIEEIPPDAFVVYQGTHGDAGAQRADIVLPSAAYTEKSCTFVNTEGRPQRTKAALGCIGEAREDWMIIRAVSEKLGATLDYDNIDDLRTRMRRVSPTFGSYDNIEYAGWMRPINGVSPEAAKGNKFPKQVDNFYISDAITRASKIMTECSEKLKNSCNSYL